MGLLEATILLTLAGLTGLALALGARPNPALALIPVGWAPLRALIAPAQGGADLREALLTLQEALMALAEAGPTTCHAAMAVGVGAAAGCLGTPRVSLRWQLAAALPIAVVVMLPAVELYTRDVDYTLVLRAIDYGVIGIATWVMLTTRHLPCQLMGGVLLLLAVGAREASVLSATLAESAGIVATSGFRDPLPLWVASREALLDMTTRSAIIVGVAALPGVVTLALTTPRPRAALGALWLLLLPPMGLRIAADPTPDAAPTTSNAQP